MDTRLRKGELLYPLMVIAAIAVTVFSIAGAATMMGWMPHALSVGQQNVRPEADERSTPPAAPTPAERKLPADGSRAAPSEKHGKGVSVRAGCFDCAVIESRPGYGAGQKVRVTDQGIAAGG